MLPTERFVMAAIVRTLMSNHAEELVDSSIKYATNR